MQIACCKIEKNGTLQNEKTICYTKQKINNMLHKMMIGRKIITQRIIFYVNY